VKHASVAARLGPILGEIATCSVIDLELLFSARSHADIVDILRERNGFPRLAMTQKDFGRAVEILERLGKIGHHRSAGIPNLLIAAVAERHGLTVLHYDKDFDVISKVTRQAAEWVVPPGSVP
jgi:predicted nucleic acid-binding protein